MFFLGNEFSSRLNAKMASQLNSDDLKEYRTGLGDVQLSQYLSRHQADFELGRFFPERICRICAEGGRAFCRQTLVQRDCWLQLVKDSKIFLAPLGKNTTDISGFASLAMTIIAPNVVLRELLGPAKRARKTVRALTEVRVLRI